MKSSYFEMDTALSASFNAVISSGSGGVEFYKSVQESNILSIYNMEVYY